MIYIEPDFLVVVCLVPPLPVPTFPSLSQSSYVSPFELTDWRGEEGVGEGWGQIIGEKAWASINHLIFSGLESKALGNYLMGDKNCPPWQKYALPSAVIRRNGRFVGATT
jgi:hypothetical protein